MDKKEKRVDGFGIIKGAPSFKKEEEEEHPEFWQILIYNYFAIFHNKLNCFL